MLGLTMSNIDTARARARRILELLHEFTTYAASSTRARYSPLTSEESVNSPREAGVVTVPVATEIQDTPRLLSSASQIPIAHATRRTALHPVQYGRRIASKLVPPSRSFSEEYIF